MILLAVICHLEAMYLPHCQPQLSEHQIRHVLTLAGWDRSLHDEAVAVSFCESRHQPAAVGDGGRARGLFQIHWLIDNCVSIFCGWSGWAWRELGIDGLRWDNPVDNAYLARLIYEHRNRWHNWTCKPAWFGL